MIVRRGTAMLAFAACGFALATGCGGGTGELRGKVTYKDKPLAVGSVQIVAADGTTLAAPIGDDGRYVLSGVPAGPAKIAVSSPNPSKQQVVGRKKDDPKQRPADASKWIAIPEKYADFDRSDLTTTIKSGATDFDIGLK